MKHFVKHIITRTSGASIIARIPFARHSYEKNVWRKAPNLFNSIFSSYEEAFRYVSSRYPQGWNEHSVAANLVGDERPQRSRNRAIGSDNPAGLPILLNQTSMYAVLLWISRLIEDDFHVVDVGGAGGIAYWNYKQYFDLPNNVKWTVVDMPEVIDRGRIVADRHGAHDLYFESNLNVLQAADILLSAGCIQYMSPSAFGDFTRLAGTASTTIINKMPLVAGPEFWTLQNLEATSTPYWIANRDQFISAFEKGGAALRDAWTVPELRVEIPFFPERYVPCLYGMVFQRNGSTARVT
jgi:putative methyltransferase (TIGR04325 family)